VVKYWIYDFNVDYNEEDIFTSHLMAEKECERRNGKENIDMGKNIKKWYKYPPQTTSTSTNWTTYQ